MTPTLTQTCKQLPSTTDHHFLPDLQTTDELFEDQTKNDQLSCKKNPVFGVCIVTGLNAIHVVTVLSSNHMPHPMRLVYNGHVRLYAVGILAWPSITMAVVLGYSATPMCQLFEVHKLMIADYETK